MNRASACCCRKLAATVVVTSPSTDRFTIPALCSPKARRNSRRASRIVPTPHRDRLLRDVARSPKKSLAASIRVTLSRVIMRVRLSRGDPGSLNPMCPVRPTPSNWMSIPPSSRIFRSYASQKAPTLLAPDRAAGDVGVRRIDVHVVEEVLLHEAPVALQGLGVHRPVFIEVEGHDVLERDLLRLWRRTSSSYTPCGVEPVASPRIARSPLAARSRTSLTISPAHRLAGRRAGGIHREGDAFAPHLRAAAVTPSRFLRVHPRCPCLPPVSV